MDHFHKTTTGSLCAGISNDVVDRYILAGQSGDILVFNKFDSVQIPADPGKSAPPASLRLFLYFGFTKVRNYLVLHFFFPPASAFLPMCPRLPGG